MLAKAGMDSQPEQRIAGGVAIQSKAVRLIENLLVAIGGKKHNISQSPRAILCSPSSTSAVAVRMTWCTGVVQRIASSTNLGIKPESAFSFLERILFSHNAQSPPEIDEDVVSWPAAATIT